jgi:hypothetical protein
LVRTTFRMLVILQSSGRVLRVTENFAFFHWNTRVDCDNFISASLMLY